MKKSGRMLSFIVGLLIFSLTSSPIGASALVDRQQSNQYTEQVLQFIQSRNETRQIEKEISLVDSSNNTVGVCFVLKPQGYIVVGKSLEVIEGNFEESRAAQIFRNLDEKKCIYGGPFSYFQKEDEQFYDLFNDRIVGPQIVQEVSTHLRLFLPPSIKQRNL